MLSKEEVEEFMSQADVVSSRLRSFVLSSQLGLGLGLGLGVIVFIVQTELPAPCLVFWLFCNFPLITHVTVTCLTSTDSPQRTSHYRGDF